MKLLEKIDLVHDIWNRANPKIHFDFWDKHRELLISHLKTCPEIFYYAIYVNQYLNYSRITEKELYGENDRKLIANACELIKKIHTEGYGDDYESVSKIAKAYAFIKYFTHKDLTILLQKVRFHLETTQDAILILSSEQKELESSLAALEETYKALESLYESRLSKLKKEKKDDEEFKSKKQALSSVKKGKKFLQLVIEYSTDEDAAKLTGIDSLKENIDQIKIKLQSKRDELEPLCSKRDKLIEYEDYIMEFVDKAELTLEANKKICLEPEMEANATEVFVKNILTGKTVPEFNIPIENALSYLKNQYPENAFEFFNNLYNINHQWFITCLKNERFQRTLVRCFKFFNPSDEEILSIFRNIWGVLLENNPSFLKYLYNYYCNTSRLIATYFNQFMLSKEADKVISFYLGLYTDISNEQYPANAELISAFFNNYLMSMEQKIRDNSVENTKRSMVEVLAGSIYKSLGLLEDVVISARNQETLTPRSIGQIMDAVVQVRNDLSDIGITTIEKTRTWRKQDIKQYDESMLPINGQEISPGEEVTLQTMGVAVGSKVIAAPICRKIQKKEEQ